MQQSRKFQRWYTTRPEPAAPVVEPAESPKPLGTPFYIALGVACALGLLAIIGTGLLFLRETQEVQAAAPAPQTAPAVQAEDLPPLNPAELPPPPLEEKAAAVKPRARAVRRTMARSAFHGTVSPAEPQPQPQPAAKPQPDEASVDRAQTAAFSEPAPPPVEKAAAAQPVAEAAPPAAAETRSPHPVKRVFGAIFKPFRSGKRSATAE